VLSEALYTMANDHILAHHVVWPVAQRNFDHGHEDPYSKYFELWKRGAQLHYTKAGEAIVCCSLA